MRWTTSHLFRAIFACAPARAGRRASTGTGLHLLAEVFRPLPTPASTSSKRHRRCCTKEI